MYRNMDINDKNKKILTRNMAFIKYRFRSYDIEKTKEFGQKQNQSINFVDLCATSQLSGNKL